ncbi:MAG: glycoside hydrolase family 3 N-terminal domain-containing protein [Ignavibacteria bacterium]
MASKNFKIILLTGLVLVLTFLFVKCNRLIPVKKQTDSNDNAKELSFSTYKILIDKKISEMTLREKIAQMVISSIVPDNLDEKSTEFIRVKKLCTDEKIGGFIFFKGRASEYSWLSNKLQNFSGTPLLISADFERGTGMRVTDGTLFPNNMAIGATDNPDLAYKMGLIIGSESRALGVGQDYCPVCDVNNNPDNPIINVRSFGEDPGLVSKMANAMIKGLQEKNVISTAKHFPGHGDTEIDSHKDLPVLNFSMDRLEKIELVPFKSAINSGVRSVMVAHLSFPELESNPKIPASLSSNIVQGLLIDKLGFNGLIVTDALNMQGITKYFNTQQVAKMCVEAGIDLILMPIGEKKTIDAIEAAVKNNEITEERINRSVEKILAAKMWLGLFDNKTVNENDVQNKVNTAENNALSQKIADESITLVKDDNNVFPVRDKNEKILAINLSDGKENINSDYFSKNLKGTFPNTDVIDISSDITEESVTAYTNKASSYDYIIIGIFAKVKYGTGKITLPLSQINLIKALANINNKLSTISFGNPYLLTEFPSVPCYICSYGDADVSIKAVLKAISGDIHFKGKLPVSINDNYKFGTGIQK